MSLTIDMVPRMAMITVSPVGLHLASRGPVSWSRCPSWLFALIWFAGGDLDRSGNGGRSDGMGTARGGAASTSSNGLIMLVACLRLARASAIASILNGAPFTTMWLAVKVSLAGGVFLVSTLMAVFYAPVEALLARLREEGSSPALEAQIRTQVNRGAFWTVVLFAMLATIGFLGLVKPV